MSLSSENEDKEINEQSSNDEEVQSGEEAEEDTENATHDDEESGVEEPDINASATESDEDEKDDDDEVDDDKDVPAITPKIKNKSSKRADKITKAVKEQNEKRVGRQLFIRFPEKLPETMEDFQKKVKSLSELIIDAHKPRQKHARFCLVDFANTEDRDKALKKLSKNDSKMVVSLPKTDNEDFIKTLVEKKIQKAEKKRAKNLLRQQSKKTVTEKTYTSTIMVLNLPNSASNAQIKELFPDAVDIQTKSANGKYVGKMIATVTLPSTDDARKNALRKLTLGGNQLIIKFHVAAKKTNRKKNKKPLKSAIPAALPEEQPVAKSSTENKKSELSKKPIHLPKKRSISENGDTTLPEKKNKVEVNVNSKGAKKGKQFGKGKKPMPTNKTANQDPNGKPGGKPNKQNKQTGKKQNKQNKQKNQPQKKGKGVLVPAE